MQRTVIVHLRSEDLMCQIEEAIKADTLIN